MLTKIKSVAFYGLKCIELDIEVNIASKGFPSFTIVGMKDKCANESKERIKTAIINSGYEFPMSKITVNVAPADVSKESSAYDLPIAVGILAAIGEIDHIRIDSYYYGELALDGGLRHTKGVFMLAAHAKDTDVKSIFVPKDSCNEANVVKGIEVYAVNTLKDIIDHLNGRKIITSSKAKPAEFNLYDNVEFDFNEIYGQESAKRALEIAAAGGHNVMMLGPPGSGKTMLSRATAGILPVMTDDESLEVTKIYSVSGNIPSGGSIIRHRPFRAPHHTTSLVGLIGGGSNPHPGEISLAHRGVLFIDEFPEVKRDVLEALRQPLEDGAVTISRSSGTIRFPAKFMLLASANPCPCGHLGDTKKECKCTTHDIFNYQKKLSGPIMDRIDMHLTVPVVDIEKYSVGAVKINTDSSEIIKNRVQKARSIQTKRFDKHHGVYCNSDMKNKHIEELAMLTQKANTILKMAINKYSLSSRSYFRLIKVSRTIADLDNSREILEEHAAESLQYRINSI